MLAGHEFSDLLLFSKNGSAKFKGCPGAGSQLMPVPDDCLEELDPLDALLSESVRDNASVRIFYGGVHYRVACITDVSAGRTYFLRKLPPNVPDMESLGIKQPYITDWLMGDEQKQGLVLISGAQASGKTTLASSLVAARLRSFGGHAVTFEIPAELPLAGAWGEHGYCFQKEIMEEAQLAKEIECAHRYASPDIIFIGEIRTRHAALESLRVALGSSRQMVVATIHGLDVVNALERLLSWAQELDGKNACQNLADALLAVVHVELHNDAKGKYLTSPEFLLLPFHSSTRAVRAKLRDGQFHNLGDDMRELKNRIAEEYRRATPKETL